MTSQGVPPSQRWLAVTTVVAMASGLVVALGAIAPVSWPIVLTAAALFIASIGAFGALTFRDARTSGSTFVTALSQSVRTAGKALLALMP